VPEASRARVIAQSDAVRDLSWFPHAPAATVTGSNKPAERFIQRLQLDTPCPLAHRVKRCAYVLLNGNGNGMRAAVKSFEKISENFGNLASLANFSIV
jgi:hypothetical protein